MPKIKNNVLRAKENDTNEYTDIPVVVSEESFVQANNAEAWAKGTKNGVTIPDTDPAYHNNAKYYSEVAEYEKGLAVQAMQGAVQMAQAAVSYSLDAEAWANGTRGGDDIGSTDPAYHKNSKYYSAEAEYYKGLAAEAQGAAATYANNAAQSAASIAGETAQIAQNTADIAQLKSDFYYTPVNISAFTASVTQAEKGSTVNAVTLSYTINTVPTTLTLDGSALTPAKTGTIPLTNLGLTSDKTWTLVAKDSGSASESPKTSTKTAKLEFMNRAYWGAAASGTVNSAFVLALSDNTLTKTRVREITVTAGSGKYIWYAVPKSLGACSFNIGGFDGGFESAQTVSVTNASGFAENYYVYRSTNPGLGSTTIKIT